MDLARHHDDNRAPLEWAQSILGAVPTIAGPGKAKFCKFMIVRWIFKLMDIRLQSNRALRTEQDLSLADSEVRL